MVLHSVPEPEAGPSEPITVDAKAPDLPSVDLPDAGGETGNGKRKKSTKKLLTPPKPVEKPKTNVSVRTKVNIKLHI